MSDADNSDPTARREFLGGCSSLVLAAAGSSLMASAVLAAPGTVKRYATSILSEEQGGGLRVSTLKPLVNYLFHYPYVSTPCLLLDMGRDVGGVGRSRSVVAFSAICSHKLAYPAREVSFIRFQAKASGRSEAERIHCCADHSVYDPAQDGRVVAGPAPVALARVVLEYDRKADSLAAVGISGVDQFDDFFAKYEFKLSMEYGGRARNPSGRAAVVQELTRFCRNVAQC